MVYEFERPDLLALSVQAPLPLGGVLAGGFEWYRMAETGQRQQPTLRASLAALERFLRSLPTRPHDLPDHPSIDRPHLPLVDPARIVLAGFSQGAVTALGMLALRPDLLCGVMALSGHFPFGLPDAEAADLRNCPVFAAHGLHDDVIPIQAARQTRTHLTRRQANLTYHEYPMAHQVHPQEMTDARAWLTDRLLPSALT